MFEVQQFTGRLYGWECVTTEATREEAQKRLQEYRENQLEYPVRVRRKVNETQGSGV